MKKVLLSLSLLAFTAATTISVTSCDKIKDKVAENVKYDFVFQTAEVTLTIPVVTSTNSLVEGGTVSQPLDVNAYIKAETEKVLGEGKGFGIEKLNSAKLKSCKLTIVEGADADNNFQNFSFAGVMFNTNPEGSNAGVEIAQDVADVYSIELNPAVPATDMLPYIKADKLDYLMIVNARKTTTHELKVRVQLAFDINVGG